MQVAKALVTRVDSHCRLEQLEKNASRTHSHSQSVSRAPETDSRDFIGLSPEGPISLLTLSRGLATGK